MRPSRKSWQNHHQSDGPTITRINRENEELIGQNCHLHQDNAYRVPQRKKNRICGGDNDSLIILEASHLTGHHLNFHQTNQSGHLRPHNKKLDSVCNKSTKGGILETTKARSKVLFRNLRRVERENHQGI